MWIRFFPLFLISVFSSGSAFAELKYFNSSNDLNAIMNIVSTVCQTNLGQFGYDFERRCDGSGECKDSIEVTAGFYGLNYYITPKFNVLFDSRFREYSKAENYHGVIVGDQYFYPLNYEFNSEPIDEDELDALQACVGELGETIFDENPYEIRVSSLSLQSSSSTLTVEQELTLPELFGSILYLTHPVEVEAGETFFVSAVFLPSLALSAEREPMETDESSAKRLVKSIVRSTTSSGMHLVEEINGDVLISDYEQMDVQISSWTGVKHKERDPFEYVTLSLTGANLSIEQISSSEQQVRGLQPMEWHWAISTTSDVKVPLVISAKENGNQVAQHTVVFEVQTTKNYFADFISWLLSNIEWMLVGLVVPFLLVMFKLRVGAKD